MRRRWWEGWCFADWGPCEAALPARGILSLGRICDVRVEPVSPEANVINIAKTLFHAGGNWLKFFAAKYLDVTAWDPAIIRGLRVLVMRYAARRQKFKKEMADGIGLVLAGAADERE